MDINQIQLIGDRVLIQLDQLPTHSTTQSGLEIPLYDAVVTEGGRVKSQLSQNTFLYQGTILQISPLAEEALTKEASPLSPGQKVYVTPSAVTPHYQFFLDRSSLVLDFNGLIAIPHQLIEAYVK